MIDSQIKIHAFLLSLVYKLNPDNIIFDYNSDLQKFLSNSLIKYEKIREESIIIEYSDLSYKIFNSEEDYLTENNVKNTNNILIKNVNGKTMSKLEGLTFVNFEKSENNFFFKNAESFILFIDYLKSLSNDSEDAFHFIDYVNDVNRTIVLTSLSEKSRLIIKYRREVPIFDERIDHEIYLKNFMECFENKKDELVRFLKSSLIKHSSRFDQNNRIKNIFENLDLVVNEAKMNFEIYINNLSIDKIRKDYDEYKSKYFSEVSDILNKLTQKIISFPIVIGSMLFAIEKIKHNTIFLYILLFVIILTTGYLVLLLKMNFKDLNFINLLAEKDYNLIKDNLFFKKFPEQFKTFKDIKDRIANRIKNLLIISETYFWMLSIFNTVIISYILQILDVQTLGIIFIGLAILFLLILVKNNIWKEKSSL